MLAGAVGPERVRIIRGYCLPDVDVEIAPLEAGDGRIDVDRLRDSSRSDGRGVPREPELPRDDRRPRADLVADVVQRAGGLLVVGVDPISLGVLAPPPRYGADIVCGELQPLGIHMHYGGGLAGFVATPDRRALRRGAPGILLGLSSTARGGRARVRLHPSGSARLHPAARMATSSPGRPELCGHHRRRSICRSSAPEGLEDVGRMILERAHYAAERLAELPGVRAPALAGPFFKEFVVRFDGRIWPGPAEVNRAAARAGIPRRSSAATRVSRARPRARCTA